MARPKKAAKSGRKKPGRHRAAEQSGKPVTSYGPWWRRRLSEVTAPAVPLLAVGALVAGTTAAAVTGVRDALAEGQSVTSELAPSGRVDLSLREDRADAAGRSADRSALRVRPASVPEKTTDPSGADAEPGSTAGRYGLGEEAIIATLEGQQSVRARTERVSDRVAVAIREAEEARKRAAREAAERRRAAALAAAWHAPLDSYSISATFGEAGSYWSSGYHTGLDLSASTGTPIHSVGPGEIVEAAWDGAYGNRIKVRHEDGTETWYCHMTSFERTSGSVGGGDVIGYVGSTGNSTGPHLHIEVRPYGDGGDPIDPYDWLAGKGVNL